MVYGSMLFSRQVACQVVLDLNGSNISSAAFRRHRREKNRVYFLFLFLKCPFSGSNFLCRTWSGVNVQTRFVVSGM